MRDAALLRLTRRDHSVAELKRKLLDKGYEPELVESLIENFLEKNLLDDGRFAESYLTMRARAGFGPLRIREELKGRGVSEFHIQNAFQFFEEEREFTWLGLLEFVWQKKFRSEQAEDQQSLAKQIRFLQQRGFELGMIREVVE